MLVLWLWSVARRDASVVDAWWGPLFLAVAAVAAAVAPGDPARRLLTLGLVAAWSLRLAGHIAWRNRGHGEDYRYRAMRQAHGARFWWVSLFTVFLFQGVLAIVISLPLVVAVTAPAPGGLGWLDLAGAALWLTGFLFEAVGDWQLARFKAEAANRGRVMDRGLWSWTRHPNYFGETLLWWGFWLLAAGTPAGLWTVFSPLLMTFLLLRVSGVALLEKGLAASKPGYAAYVERTSAFLPRPPRRAG
jgi:steroid 5-alpha reductase family enzyme